MAMMARYLLLLLLAQAACRAPLLAGADPYDEDEDDEDEDEDEDEADRRMTMMRMTMRMTKQRMKIV